MGISKTHRRPNEYFIKARVKTQGEDRRKQEFFLGTKGQAQDRYLELKAELRGTPKQARTFGHLLENYRESRGEIPRSQRSIFDALSRDLGPIDLQELEGALKQYHGILRRLPSKATGKHLSSATLNRYRAMVAAALNLAVELKVIPSIPLSSAVWPKGKEIPRDRFLSPLEVQRLFGVLELEAPHLLPMTQFALQVPCRKSELVHMTRADLDLFNEAIRVHNGTTKNEDGTWKPIPPELVPYFRSLPADCQYLFHRKGAFLGDFKKAWGRCLEIAGLQNFRFHDTRHISATNLVDNGTPERAVMDIAGWRTNMLATYYKSSSKKALGLVKFARGSGNKGATSESLEGKGGGFGIEKAVS